MENPFEQLNRRLNFIELLLRDVSKKIAKEEAQEQLLSPGEAVKLWSPKVSTQTLSNWSKQGLIPKHSIGGKTFYKKSEILASLQTLKKYKASRPLSQPPLTAQS
jgi:hypothetical protein